tara:strand:+ start:290 stop:532 length:243 start_codon:yes stop_codon:yes gene_type:complete
MKYGNQYPAAIIITDTNTHTGRFGRLHALEQATTGLITAKNITENGSSTIDFLTIKPDSEIEGVITSIKLTSGSVIAYYL